MFSYSRERVIHKDKPTLSYTSITLKFCIYFLAYIATLSLELQINSNKRLSDNICHVALNINLHLRCPYPYCIYIVFRKVRRHHSVLILLRRASYKTSRVCSYMRVQHTHLRGKAINKKRYMLNQHN